MTDKPLGELKKDDAETNSSSLTMQNRSEDSSEASLEAGNGLHAKRGRMITAGIVATIVLAVVSILVSGIFQLTSRWVMICPKDLPVNDPAPILWQTVVADKPGAAPLGVPEKVLSAASFRGSSEAGSEEKAK